MTLGGLVKHLAVVEDSWFGEVFLGGELSEPWASVDWEADRDWEWHSAAQDSPEQLLALFDAAVSQAERITDEPWLRGASTPSRCDSPRANARSDRRSACDGSWCT